MTKKKEAKESVQRSAFDTSGPSLFGAELQLHANRNHVVTKFGQHIVINDGATRTWGPLDQTVLKKTKSTMATRRK